MMDRDLQLRTQSDTGDHCQTPLPSQENTDTSTNFTYPCCSLPRRGREEGGEGTEMAVSIRGRDLFTQTDEIRFSDMLKNMVQRLSQLEKWRRKYSSAQGASRRDAALPPGVAARLPSAIKSWPDSV